MPETLYRIRLSSLLRSESRGVISHYRSLLRQGQIQGATTNQFNSCLLNRYRSGNDSLAYHSDNEREYGSTPVIASLSLGSMRDFVLRRNADHRDKIVFKLASGDLLVLRGTVQQYWMHSVPRRKGAANEERINLTFRNVLTSFS